MASQALPCVEPATVAAASTPSATYGARPWPVGRLVRTAITAEAAIATISPSWRATEPGLPCRLRAGPSSSTGTQTSTEACRCTEHPSEVATLFTLRRPRR